MRTRLRERWQKRSKRFKARLTNKLSIRNKRLLVFSSLLLFAFVMSMVSAQDISVEKLAGVEVDQIQVIYAVDGYMSGPGGDTKYFIFGVVRLHKPGAPEDEWSDPVFYFEFDGKAVLGGTASYHYFLEENDDGTLRHLPILRELWSTSSGFELDFVFTKTGEIDTSKSSMSIVPPQYKTGRTVRRRSWTGEYYKKGSNTVLFVPTRDEAGKVINQVEAGEPVIEEIAVNILDVCYEEIMGGDIYYLKANLGNLSYHNGTGLCTVYTIQSINRSAGLPDARALGLISTDFNKSSAPKSESLGAEETTTPPPLDSSYITNVTVKPPTLESLRINRTPSNKTEPPEELNVQNEEPGVINPPEKPPVTRAPPTNKSGG